MESALNSSNAGKDQKWASRLLINSDTNTRLHEQKNWSRPKYYGPEQKTAFLYPKLMSLANVKLKSTSALMKEDFTSG